MTKLVALLSPSAVSPNWLQMQDHLENGQRHIVDASHFSAVTYRAGLTGEPKLPKSVLHAFTSADTRAAVNNQAKP